MSKREPPHVIKEANAKELCPPFRSAAIVCSENCAAERAESVTANQETRRTQRLYRDSVRRLSRETSPFTKRSRLAAVVIAPVLFD